jgi:hypothetical protein
VATEIAGIKLITPVRHVDSSGFFSEVFKENVLRKHGIDIYFVQDNHSSSASKGVGHGEQGDLVGGTLGRIEELAGGRNLDVSLPDFQLLVLGRLRGRRRRGTDRRLRRTPGEVGIRRHRADAVDEGQRAFAGIDRVLRDVS